MHPPPELSASSPRGSVCPDLDICQMSFPPVDRSWVSKFPAVLICSQHGFSGTTCHPNHMRVASPGRADSTLGGGRGQAGAGGPSGQHDFPPHHAAGLCPARQTGTRPGCVFMCVCAVCDCVYASVCTHACAHAHTIVYVRGCMCVCAVCVHACACRVRTRVCSSSLECQAVLAQAPSRVVCGRWTGRPTPRPAATRAASLQRVLTWPSCLCRTW